MSKVTVICGGVGAAKLLRGLIDVVDPADITAVVNVGDDSVLHGLEISPDLDTITYTLADAIDPARGWGLRDESWRAMEQVRSYAAANDIDPEGHGNDAAGWFSLGDRDLGTHLYRTSRRHAGASLSEVTAEICRAWDVGVHVVPATDHHVRTMLHTVDGRTLSFQEYFVREQHGVAVRSVDIVVSPATEPAPGVLDAIANADAVIIAPSNPVVSIDPVLSVPGVRDAIAARRDRVVAISPIVGGAALKGPADRLLRELGHDSSVVAVAKWYRDLASVLLIDDVDAGLADDVENAGIGCTVAPSIMTDPAAAAELCRRALGSVGVAP